MSTQKKVTDSFKVVKNACSFYGKKKVLQEEEDLTSFVPNSISDLPYTPTTRKIVELTDSDSDSDSNAENCTQTPILKKNSRKCRYRENFANDLSLSPPKMRKTTPRKAAKTPTRNSKLATKVPSTPLSNFHIADTPKKMSPKKLFSLDVYQNARKSLHSSLPQSLPGREVEMEQLEEFISGHIKKKTSGSLYISGPPGTGKTASLSTTIKKFQKLKTVYINCTDVKSASAIYKKIVDELDIDSQKRNKKAVIEEYLTSSRKTLVLILDEIDQLSTKNQQVLYSIFEWPHMSKSKLILIGIANALDLTERILPRLQTRCEVKPEVMIFVPYTREQIQEIIIDRLRRAGATDIFPEAAISLLARKVSAASGDIRKSLDISRRVIEFVESRRTACILQPTTDNESNIDAEKIVPAELKVSMKDVLDIINAVQGGSQNIDEEESKFTLQQKIILCSLMLILEKGKNKDIELGRLYNVYEKVCRKQKIGVLSYNEFVGVCNLIDVHGIFNVSLNKKELRHSKVILKWDQEALIAALSDKNLTSQIIDDVSCL